MSEERKRKVHTPEFKTKVALEAMQGQKTINEICQEHGVPPVMVGQWKKEIQEHAKTLFVGKRGPEPIAAHREPEVLCSEIGKLKMKLDWQKKTGIYFIHLCAPRQKRPVVHLASCQKTQDARKPLC